MATLNTATTSSLSGNIMTWIDKVTLQTLIPSLVFNKLAVKKQVPLNSGKTATWILYTRVAGSTTSVTEDTVPNGTALTTTTVTVTLNMYGQYVPIENFLFLTSRDDVIKSAMARLVHAASDTIDLITRNAITAGSTNYFANGKTALSQIAVGDILTITDLRKVRRNMKENFALPFTGGNYKGILHPRQFYDLASQTGTATWSDLRKYTENTVKDTHDAAIGTVEGIEWMESQNVFSTTSGTSASNKAYYACAAGDDSIGTVDLETGLGKPRFDVLKPRESGINDPLGQYHVVAYKIEAFAAKVLLSTTSFNIISAATQT